ncbi:MAG: extracellular solute-binding protein, partial [Streptosporangiales bacterium]|nr:extracellular solute-binding protein [Streptosporangiales bacterium]
YVRGWEASLQEYVTDDFMSRWPKNSFEPGISGLHVGDELYATPFGSNGAIFPLLTNVELLDKYGIDGPPKTWSEFEDAGAKISTDSKGKVRGFYPVVHYMLAAMQATAGPDLMASGGDIKQGGTAINLKTGRSEAASEQMVSLAKLLQRMSKNDSLIRGWEGEQAQLDPAFWKALAQERVAMAIGSNWHYREILRLRKDLPLSIDPVPVPDDGRKGYQTKAFVFLPYWHISAKSKKKKQAWKLLDLMGTPEHVLAWYKISKRNPPAFPLAEFEEFTDKWDKRMLEVKKDTMRFAPNATMKSIDAAAVQAEMQSKAPTPTVVEMFAEALSKPTSYDYEAKAAAYDEQNDKTIAEVIKKAEDDDKKVSADTFKFPDWDPLENYAPEGVTVPTWS